MRNPTITIIFTNVVPLISKPMEHLEVLLKSRHLYLSQDGLTIRKLNS